MEGLSFNLAGKVSKVEGGGRCRVLLEANENMKMKKTLTDRMVIGHLFHFRWHLEGFSVRSEE
jgi:hypothetical protein